MTQSGCVNINHRALEKKDKIVYFVFAFMHSTTLVEIESQEICARNLHVCKQCRSRRRKGKPVAEDLCPSSAASAPESTVQGSSWKEATPSPDSAARLLDWLELQRLWTG